MLEILQFIFSGFWVWLGTVILILVVGTALGIALNAFCLGLSGKRMEIV